MSETDPLLRARQSRTEELQEVGDTSSAASGFSEVSDSFEPPARPCTAKVTRGPSFDARDVLCACESRLPNLLYLLSAAHVQQVHLSRPKRELCTMFRAPPDGRLVHMAKLITHHVVFIATPSPSHPFDLVFLREQSSQFSLLSCFGWRGKLKLDEDFTIELSCRLPIAEVASVVQFSDKRLFILPRRSALVHVVDVGSESDRLPPTLPQSTILFQHELMSAERLVVFGAELLAVSCTDGCVRLMRYAHDRTLEEVQQFSAFWRPLAPEGLLWDPVHSLLFLLAHKRDSSHSTLHCLYVKRKDPKPSVLSVASAFVSRMMSASAATSSNSANVRIELKYAGEVARFENSLKTEHMVLAGRDFGSERRRLLFLDAANASFTQYFIEF